VALLGKWHESRNWDLARHSLLLQEDPVPAQVLAVQEGAVVGAAAVVAGEEVAGPADLREGLRAELADSYRMLVQKAFAKYWRTVG
jgi:hypothetical protein